MTATLELVAPSGPFDVPMTKDGVFDYRLVINAEGLPPASSLGPYTVYVAWATSLTMDSVVKLGVVRNGRTSLGALARNQFRVLVSAERSPAVTARHGRLVLRGASPSVRLLAHRDLFTAMPGAMDMTMPSRDPSLPEPQPSSMLSLHDGDTLSLVAGLVRGGYGYNGQYPGPRLLVPRGSVLIVRFENRIDQPTTVHWHGVRVDNAYDGTQDPVPAGGTFTYRVHFPDAGVFWYHSHVNESQQVGLGLFGTIIVTDSAPRASQQVALAIQDVSVDPFGGHALMGRFGETVLLNGATRYTLLAHRGSVVRFLVTNASNARTYNLSFGDAPMKIVASDLGAFEHQAIVPSVLIAPAERYTIDVRFTKSVVVTNRVQALNHWLGVFSPEIDTLGAIRVDSAPAVPDYAASFGRLERQDELTAYRQYLDHPVDHRLNLEMRLATISNMLTGASVPVEVNDGMPAMNRMITPRDVTWILRDTDTGAENTDINWHFPVGAVAKVRIYNDAIGPHPMAHPIHVHGQRMLLLSRNGVPNENLVWKDTILIPAGETDDVLIEFSNPGRWMLHCHIAEHRAAGMMMMFTVD
ncbi:MAG TPA: multicopper oxidase family protein [Gemmatimonadaceae bacterium]|nr:multicopper oxidase family protein [Gemmatimonadaceae bacterium]